MARMMPSLIHPGCSSPGEREVFYRLKNDPGTTDWIVLHSLDVADHPSKIAGELDFVVIIPHKGILCVEVKACRSLRRTGGNWYYGTNPRPDPRGPFKQVSEAMHSIRSEIAVSVPSLSRVVLWSAVIFPYIDFNVQSKEWHDWQVIDSKLFRARPISQLLETVIDSARAFLEYSDVRWFWPGSREPYPQQCQEIADLLRPEFELFEGAKSKAVRRENELKMYTSEQFQALDAMESNPRVVFSGPAGTGKTFLAIEAARRSLAQGQRVLFLCYNRLLGQWLEEETRAFGKQLVTRTMHKHMLEVSGRRWVELDRDQLFWQEELPSLAIDALLQQTEDDNVFDMLIVDEAQDILRDAYLDFLDLSLKGGLAAGRWRIFGDFEKQAIFTPSGETLDTFLATRAGGAPQYLLRVNCRNTPRISTLVELLGGLDPRYTRVLRPDDGIEPQMHFYASVSEQQEKLIGVLEMLYRDGYSGKDIVLLSSRADGSAAQKLSVAPWKDRLCPVSRRGKDNIGYCSVHAFKGLESPCVILTDVDRMSDDHSKALFYVGITRALDRLVILSHESAKSEVANILLSGPRS